MLVSYYIIGIRIPLTTLVCSVLFYHAREIVCITTRKKREKTRSKRSVGDNVKRGCVCLSFLSFFLSFPFDDDAEDDEHPSSSYSFFSFFFGFDAVGCCAPTFGAAFDARGGVLEDHHRGGGGGGGGGFGFQKGIIKPQEGGAWDSSETKSMRLGIFFPGTEGRERRRFPPMQGGIFSRERPSSGIARDV